MQPKPIKKSGPILPARSGTARSAMIILHGYGADADDLFPLAGEWADDFPDTVFIALNAPYPCEGNPYGKQWFSLFDLDKSDQVGRLTYWPVEKILSGLREASATVDHWIDEILSEYSIADDQLILSGFSQGCMLSLHTGLRRKKTIGGIVGWSGRLLAPQLLTSELQSKPPVFLMHGDADEIVPPASLAEAEAALKSHGIDVQTEMRPNMGHSIDGQEIELTGEFLRRILAS